jgi:hypothetical protein
MRRQKIQVVVRARTGSDELCRLAMDLTPKEGPYPEGKYLDGTLSLDMPPLRLRFALPLTVESQSLRRFVDEARSMHADNLDGKAVLCDYDGEPVLAVTWVRVNPPVLVISGEYSSYVIPHGDLHDVDEYPYRAENKVQYTALEIDLADLQGLVSDLQSGLERLGIP